MCMSIETNLAKRFAVNDSGEAATTRAQAWSRGVQKHNWRVLTAGENNFVVSTDRKSKAWSSAVFMQLSMSVYVCACVCVSVFVCAPVSLRARWPASTRALRRRCNTLTC